MSGKQSINLLQRSDFEKSAWGRMSIWALSVGRWVVILTELVVISAFIYRFSLDQSIAVYKEQIEEKRSAVDAFESQEARFRETQKRLSVLEQAFKSYRDLEPIFDDLKISLPEGLVMSLIEVQLANNINAQAESLQITMQGTAQTEESVSSLRSNLERADLFNRVIVAELSLETEELTDERILNFTIVADIAN